MVNVHSCHLLSEHFQFTFIHGPNIPGFYAVVFFAATNFTSITSHIHNTALFSLWRHLFILSGVISPLFSSSILGTWGVHLSMSYLVAFSYCSSGSQSKNTFPSPVDHILSELSTMTHLFWVALCGMAHSFTELNKAVIHVISLVVFLIVVFILSALW